MARRMNAAPSLPNVVPNLLFANPYSGQTGVPTQLNNDLDRMGAAHQNAYAQKSWANQHPVLTGLLGGVLAGPAGAALFPMVARNNDARRHADVLKSWQEYQKNAIANQNQLNPIIESANRGTGLANLANNAGYESPLPSGAQIDATTLKNILDGMSAGDTANETLTTQERAFTRGWNKGGNVFNAMQKQQTGNAPANLMMARTAPQAPDTMSQLSGGVSSETQAPLRPAIYRNPDIVKAGVDNASRMFNQGIEAFPKYAELPAAIAKAVAEGDAASALALLRQAQTATEQQRPALIQAQTSATQDLGDLRRRTDPNARGLNVIDLMSPQQRQQYASVTAAGKANNGPDYNPDQAKAEFQLQSIINSPTDSKGNPISPETKAAAQMALDRLMSNKRSQSLPASPSRSVPSGKGSVSVKGSRREWAIP